MFGMINLLKTILYPKTYIWIDVLLIRETSKAILIKFDGRKEWLLKTWILRVKRNKNNNSVKIKISEYCWIRKFQ